MKPLHLLGIAVMATILTGFAAYRPRVDPISLPAFTRVSASGRG